MCDQEQDLLRRLISSYCLYWKCGSAYSLNLSIKTIHLSVDPADWLVASVSLKALDMRVFWWCDYTLCVGALENKTDLDTTKDAQGNIVNDILLNIEKIEIDDIDLGNLIWQSEFIPDVPREYQGQTVTKLQGCVNLGWNGTYILKFTSPFYLWLLENL